MPYLGGEGGEGGETAIAHVFSSLLFLLQSDHDYCILSGCHIWTLYAGSRVRTGQYSQTSHVSISSASIINAWE